jgi:hypothetical protein
MPTTGRYTSKARVVQTSITRTPWRHRQQTKKTQSQTPAERQVAKENARQRKAIVNQSIDRALADVWKIAERLFQETGTNTVKFWYEFLLQRSGKKRHERAVNSCDAFLSTRVKSRNDDELLGLCAATRLKYVQYRAS